jgi:hypothetical protein
VAYSVEDLRAARARKAEQDLAAPADAPHSTRNVLGCWNGSRFVSWDEWVIHDQFGERAAAVEGAAARSKRPTRRA